MAAVWLEFLTAVLFIVLLLRIAYVLSSNPIGELTQELVYLRSAELRAPAFFVFSALLLEAAEFAYPLVQSALDLAEAPAFAFYVNAFQAILVLAATVLLFIVVQRYTHRGLDRRIREAMETLAYLAGQRRRRARARGERIEGGDEVPARRYE